MEETTILPGDPGDMGGDRCFDTETKESNECEAKIALDSADNIYTGSEQPAEEPEGRRYDRVMTTGNALQQIKDPPE